jgi:hypothetical protein
MRIMRATLFLLLALPLALGAGCSKPEPQASPAPPPAEKKAESRPEAKPVEALAEPPIGFPYALMEGDRVRQSQSFFHDGVQHYEVALESDLDPEAVADYWEAELGKRGVKVSRKRTEDTGFLLLVLEGPDEAGIYSRVSVLQNRGQDPGGGKTPTKVNVFLGKR